METFNRSLNENFPQSDEPVNTREYSREGVQYREDEYDNGSVSVYTFVEESGEWEFANSYESRDAMEAKKSQEPESQSDVIVYKVMSLFGNTGDYNLGDHNQAEQLIKALELSSNEIHQDALEKIKANLKERINSLEQEMKTISGSIDNFEELFGADYGMSVPAYDNPSDTEKHMGAKKGYEENDKRARDISVELNNLRGLVGQETTGGGLDYL